MVAEKNLFLVFASFLCFEHPSLLVSLESASSPRKVQLQAPGRPHLLRSSMTWTHRGVGVYQLEREGDIQRTRVWPKKMQSTGTQVG